LGDHLLPGMGASVQKFTGDSVELRLPEHQLNNKSVLLEELNDIKKKTRERRKA
jgi:hypothetical protein